MEQCYRTLEMLLRFAKLSGEPVGDALHAMRDTGFGRTGSRLNVREHSRGVRPHRRQFASDEGANIQAVIDRQSFGRALSPRACSRALVKARIVSGAPGPRAAHSALP